MVVGAAYEAAAGYEPAPQWRSSTLSSTVFFCNPAQKTFVSTILLLQSIARGSTLRLIKVLFQYSTEHTGAVVIASSAVAFGGMAHYIFCSPPLERKAIQLKFERFGWLRPAAGLFLWFKGIQA